MESHNNFNNNGKANSHFLNLFSLAISDSVVTAEELELLYSIGIENGVSKVEVDYLIDNPHKVRFVEPTSTDDLIEQLFDFCRMILADNKIDIREIAVFKSLASHFKISEANSENILEIFLDGLKEGESKVSLITKIKQTLINI